MEIDKNGKTWCTTEELAEYVGISVGQTYMLLESLGLIERVPKVANHSNPSRRVNHNLSRALASEKWLTPRAKPVLPSTSRTGSHP